MINVVLLEVLGKLYPADAFVPIIIAIKSQTDCLSTGSRAANRDAADPRSAKSERHAKLLWGIFSQGPAKPGKHRPCCSDTPAGRFGRHFEADPAPLWLMLAVAMATPSVAAVPYAAIANRL